MRLFFSLLACIGTGAISVAVADPPAAPDTTTATTASAQPSASAAPSTSPSAAATVSKDAETANGQEKHFLSEGYKVEMHNGTKYYCRREERLGSRLGGHNGCSTAQQLAANEAQAREMVERRQRLTQQPAGN